MEPTTSPGLAQYLASGGTIALVTFGLLLAMSIASWYFIVQKSVRGFLLRMRGRRTQFLFWNSDALTEAVAELDARRLRDPFANLLRAARQAHQHFERHTPTRGGAQDYGEFVTRSLRQTMLREQARLESGLTLLATVGATAPFVGLFGTVMGIYRALVSIGMSGLATLDKVALPVGEALIMTAIGLAVAIPAVLGYNGFVRFNRVLFAELDGFAHDLHAYLTTGARFGMGAERAQPVSLRVAAEPA